MSKELITPAGLARRQDRLGPPVDACYDHATQMGVAVGGGSARLVEAAYAISTFGVTDGPPIDADI